MRYRINSISTPYGGISWEKAQTSVELVKALFTYLESKRLLVNPIEMEKKEWCELSAIEIKNKLCSVIEQGTLKDKDIEHIKQMVDGCNVFLDKLESVKNNGIIFKNDKGDWEDYNFSVAMKEFRKICRENIDWFSKEKKIKFNKEIPEEY